MIDDVIQTRYKCILNVNSLTMCLILCQVPCDDALMLEGRKTLFCVVFELSDVEREHGIVD